MRAILEQVLKNLANFNQLSQIFIQIGKKFEENKLRRWQKKALQQKLLFASLANNT